MNTTHTHARISLTLDLSWSSNEISHLDRFFINRLNTWRDLFPGSFLAKALEPMLEPVADRAVAFDLEPGALVPDRDPKQVHFLNRHRLNDTVPFEDLRPGRFYPQGLVQGLPGIFKGNLTPFRCLERQEDGILADFNPPLAGYPLKVRVGAPVVHPASRERGGSCNDWMEAALAGPGMQSPGQGAFPDFFSGRPFEREDPSLDADFYRVDRFVHHIDDQARRNLSRWHGSLLKPGDRILDLMAGWDCHLPEDGGFSFVHGLGLNANELAANPCLAENTVQDLNQNPVLNFPDHHFDAVICALSVEYLTDPVAVFREVGRVLRPGGRFAVSFSNRWFPEKAIRIWPGLHEFERMGFVLALMKRAEAFNALATYSLRGHPRPETDPHFPQLRLSDPIFGVTGIRQ